MIRIEAEQDFLAIEFLLKQAFANHPYSQNNEYLMVNALRQKKALTLSLVFEQDNKITGYIAFSSVLINEQESNWQGIAPLAVLPEYQNQGVGIQLMQEGLKIMKQNRISGCVLVGEPEYYKRFGFKSYDTLSTHDVPSEYFLALPFKHPVPYGEVEFNSAFFEFE